MNTCSLRTLLFVIAAQLATPVIVSAETDDLNNVLCHEHWFPRNGKCFFISKYSANFYEAKENCESMDSAIAPVTSDEDQYLLISVLFDRSKTCEPHENCAEFWIGAIDPSSLNIWTTADGTTIPGVQRYWAIGYPKSKGSCVRMTLQSHNQDIRAWKNENCARSLKYVCTSPQKNRPPPSLIDKPTINTDISTRYRIINTKMTWSQAFTECAKFGPYASLAKISSAKENHDVTMYLKNEITKSAQKCDFIWIGAHIQEQNCQNPFVWQIQRGAEIPMVYSRWSPSEPNCAGGDERCVHIYMDWHFLWNDLSCHNALCSLCEMNPLV